MAKSLIYKILALIPAKINHYLGFAALVCREGGLPLNRYGMDLWSVQFNWTEVISNSSEFGHRF